MSKACLHFSSVSKRMYYLILPKESKLLCDAHVRVVWTEVLSQWTSFSETSHVNLCSHVAPGKWVLLTQTLTGCTEIWLEMKLASPHSSNCNIHTTKIFSSLSILVCALPRNRRCARKIAMHSWVNSNHVLWSEQEQKHLCLSPNMKILQPLNKPFL